MIERITADGRLLALIIRREFSSKDIEFFTPGTFSQQLGYMKRPEGYVIVPHDHNIVARVVELTQEVLLIRRGRVRVDIYAADRTYLESRVLQSGDVILLAHGGHGFQMLEESEIIEVKQGPYMGDRDKTRFDAAEPTVLRIVTDGTDSAYDTAS